MIVSENARGLGWLALVTWVFSAATALALLLAVGHGERPVPAALAWLASGTIVLLGLQAAWVLRARVRATHTQLARPQFEPGRAPSQIAAATESGSPSVLHVPAPTPASGLGAQGADGSHHLQRLEVVGHFAVGIAHDFNNTLSVILSYGELMRARLGPDHPATELAEHVVAAAEQGAVLTKQLLTFTRRASDTPCAVDVRALLETTQGAISRLIPGSIEVLRGGALAEELLVEVDALKLQQAILNLVLNARDAMPSGGELHLIAEAVSVRVDDRPVASASVAQANPGSPPARAYVAVRVRDSGMGIAPEVLPHIFEPFFTTKEPGRGTGLGLSNAREIAEESGGFASVQSGLGRGAEVSLYFPRIQGRASRVELKTSPASTSVLTSGVHRRRADG